MNRIYYQKAISIQATSADALASQIEHWTLKVETDGLYTNLTEILCGAGIRFRFPECVCVWGGARREKFPIVHNNNLTENLGIVGISFRFRVVGGGANFSELEANGSAKKLKTLLLNDLISDFGHFLVDFCHFLVILVNLTKKIDLNPKKFKKYQCPKMVSKRLYGHYLRSYEQF